MWVTVSELAKQQNITPQAIRAKIRCGKLKSCKVKGAYRVWKEDVEAEEAKLIAEDNAYNEAVKRKTQLDNELKAQKLRNLQQDTLLKKQKQTYTKQLYRQEYVQGVFQCFTESFANLKNFIVQLKMKKEDSLRFKKVIAECIRKFEVSLKHYLQEADKKELEDEATERK